MSLRAGAARADMTPPVGTPMAGFPPLRSVPEGYDGYEGRRDVSRGIHDRLLASTLAIEIDGDRALLIAVDVLQVTSEFATAVRDRLLAETGIEPHAVLIAASHTHSGPDLMGWDSGADAEVWDRALEAVVAAGKRAVHALAPAQAWWGTGQIDYLSINRIDEEDGPRDTTVRTLTLRSTLDASPIATVVHFACHPLTLGPHNLLISADFVGYLRNTLQSIFPDAPVLFFNGAAGDVQPARFPYDLRANISFSEKAPKDAAWGGFRDAERFGRCLAGAALQAIERALPLSVTSVRCRRQSVDLPLRSAEEIERFIAFFGFGPGSAMRRWSQAGAGRSEVQAISLGELSILALPGEAFVEVGASIEQRCGAGDLPLLLIGYANDDVRYVLPERFYDGGGDRYELMGTPLARNAAHVLEAGAVAVLRHARGES